LVKAETLMAKHLGTIWTERLKRADQERSERDDGWMAAAVASDCHYKGEVEHSSHNGQPITKNKQYAATQTIHAAVVPKNVRIEVKPIRPMDSGPANLMETLLRWNLHVADLRKVVEYVELDGQVKGVGISYVSWATQAAPEDVDGEAALTGKDGEAREDFLDAIESAMPHRLSHANLARIFHIDPYDFLIDPLATKMEDARWAGHRIWLTKKEVLDWKKAGFFERKELHYVQELPSSKRFAKKRTAEDILNGGGSTDEIAPGALGEDAENDFVKWEVWQIFDFRTKEVLWVIPGMKDLARDPRPNPYGNPYQAYRPNRTGDTFWSKPDSWIYAPAQQRLDEAVDSVCHLLNVMAKPSRLVAEEDAEELDVMSLADMEPGEWRAAPRNLINSITKLNDDFRLPDGFIQVIGILENVITETSAVSETASGAISSATATAHNLSAGGQSLRSGLKRRILDEWVNEIARRVAFMLKKFFTQEMAIPVLGSKAALWGADETESVTIKNEEIQGQFDFQVAAGDEAREVQVEQRKMAMDLLNLLLPFLQTGMLQVDLPRVVQWVFEQMGLPTDLVQQQQAPQVQPQLQQPGGSPNGTRPAAGGPNGGTPTDSQGVANPDGLNRDRSPTAASIGGAARRP
jgi:hypothetical protein